MPPSRELVHASATVSRRFITWLRRACKNYETLQKLEAVVNNELRKERLEQLSGAAKTELTEAIMEYEKVQADLKRIYESEAMKTFMQSDEGLLKWVGDEALSLGYTGTREKSAQHWLWDVTSGSRADEIPLPPDKKIRDVLNFYKVESYYVFHIPTQQEAETELLSFLENVKKWPRERLIWLLRNVYSLDGGGFYVTARKVIDLASLRDVWEDIIEDWKRAVEDALKKTPQYEVLKTVLGSDWEAETYLRDLTKDLETEFLEKYGNLTADIEKAKEEFYDRAPALLRQRVAPEEKLREVYEQVKPLVPPDKVELSKAGLWKAIRWAFLHPQMSVDAFASGHIWPLGVFTTEQAKAIASKILEKVTKKPAVAAPAKLSREEFDKRFDELFNKWTVFYIELLKPGLSGEIHYIVPQREMELVAKFTIDFIKQVGKDDIEKQKATSFKTYEEAYARKPEYGETYLRHLDDVTHTFARDIADKAFKVLIEEAKKAVAVPTPTEFVKVRFLKDMPAIVGADLKVYGPFAKGDVVELPKVNTDIIVKQEIATYTITPPELPTREIDALRTVVKVKADDLGLEWSDEVWSRFWKEYEARARELWVTRGVTYIEEDVENVLRAVAKPIAPPAIRRERIRRPPTRVPVEAPAEVFVEPVTIPRVPMSKLPFPRAPSTEEQAVLWDAFRYEMARLGQDPFRWRENFTMHVLNRPYPDWATITKNFSDFIEAIATGKPFRLLPLVTLPMPWREEEEEKKYDAILHFIATKLYPSMDELLHALYTYGMEVTEDDVKKAVKKGYTEKNLWLTSVSKEMLEALIAEKIG